MSSTSRQRPRPVRPAVIGVVGASGGVGTSCLAAALATGAARRDALAVCADAAPTEGGIDALFDVEARPGARWPDLAHARGRIDGAALLRHLPTSADGVRVLAATAGGPGEWSGRGERCGQGGELPGRHDPSPGRREPTPEGSGLVQPEDVITALAGAVDVVVVDLGRATGCGTTAVAACCDDVVLVVGAGVPALARAASSGVLVESMSGGRLWLAQRAPRGRADLGDLVADRLGLPLLGVVLDDPHLDDDLARGVAPGARRGRLADAAAGMWRTLSVQERAA